MHLTPRQKEILDYLGRHIEKKGYAPTIEENGEDRKQARDGEMVIALLDGENVTLKKIFREGAGRVRLQPANNRMKPIYVDQGDLRIQGVVIGVLRKY